MNVLSSAANPAVNFSAPENSKANYDYIPALDGFRGASILLLMVSHGGLQHVVPGLLSLLCFFVISSFLITRQMIVEIESTGTMQLKAFYLRRLFRLIPALLFFILFFTLLLRPLGVTVTPMQMTSVLFYFANYYHIFVGYPPGNPFPIVWSLSVEEHYYIVLPFGMLLFSRDLRKILPWLIAVLVLVPLWRVRLYHICLNDASYALCGLPGSPRWKGTDVMFDCVLYGAVFSLLLQYYNSAMRRWLINRSAFALSLAGIGVSLVLRDPAFRETYRFSLQSFCLSVMVINVLFGQWSIPRTLLSCRPLLFFGQISYSLYLFHFGVLVTMETLGHPVDVLRGVGNFCIYCAVSCTLAMLSYYIIERPMIRVRKRFGSHRKEAVG